MITPRPAHDPFPQHAMHAVPHELGDINPLAIRHKLPEQAALRLRQEALVGSLEVVEEDGFGAVTGVDVAEDVEAGFHAPDFAEEVGVSEA
jgi:hypothetical protein